MTDDREPPPGGSIEGEEPFDRLTRLCETMTTAFEADAEHLDSDKAVVLVSNGLLHGQSWSGYEDEREIVDDLLGTVKAILEANGIQMRVARFGAPLGNGGAHHDDAN